MADQPRLRVYRFDSTATLSGAALAAVERLRLAPDTELLDALFVMRDAETGDLEAVDLAAVGGDATLSSLLDFRLEPRRRRAITERTLAERRGGVPRSTIEAIGAALPAGAALFAVLCSGPADELLDDTVVRSGGRPIADEPVDARMLAQAHERLLAAVAPATGA